MKPWAARFAFVALVLAGALAFADEVKKKDGTVVSGEIIEEDDDSVTVRHKLGDIKIPKAQVDKIERKPPPVDFARGLEKIKEETASSLERLAQQADEAEKKDVAATLRDFFGVALRWNLNKRPAEKAPEKTSDDAPLDYGMVIEKWNKATFPTRNDKARRELCEEWTCRTVRFRVKVVEVIRQPHAVTLQAEIIGPRAAGPWACEFAVPINKGTLAKLEKASKGSTLTATGALEMSEHSGPRVVCVLLR